MTRTAAALLLLAYSYVVVRLTLEPASAGMWAFSLADRIATRTSGGQLQWSQTEVLANVALFVPAGFLLAVVLGRPWLAAALCVVTSAGIEVVQYTSLPSRVGSVLDVEHNALGGLIGAAVAWPLIAAFSRRPSTSVD
ncbi:MAG: VanZ family protein [Marmoricola sp.]